MNRFVYRLLTDPRCSLGWLDLRSMTILQMDDVHRYLDLLDEVEELARPE